MTDCLASASHGPQQPSPTHLIGVGPDQEFATARQLTDRPVLWLRSITSLAELPDLAPHSHPFVLLVDGDLPWPDLIEMLDQYAALVSIRPIIFQISSPSVRTVVAIMQRGILDVLAKPYTLARLNTALDEILAQPHRRLL